MAAGQKKNVVIVEDNDLNLKLFRDLLQQNGYGVEDTKDGRQALALIQQAKPDLVIMDIQLHGVSGFDLIRQIKADPELKVIPVIAVTAFAMKDDKARILASGCEAYVSKPIAIQDFLQTVSQFLRQG